MARRRDYYEVLGVPKTADEKFKEATEAYEILKDTEKRKLYDRFGMAAFDGSMDAGAYRSSDQTNADYSTYEDLFRSFFDGGFGHAHHFRRGEDVTAQIHISFDEAVSGCSKIISYWDENGMTQSLQVTVPAGIDTGKKIRLQGMGVTGAGAEGPATCIWKWLSAKRPALNAKGMTFIRRFRSPMLRRCWEERPSCRPCTAMCAVGSKRGRSRDQKYVFGEKELHWWITHR